MSACEVCWSEAYFQSRLRGGSQVDHYRALIEAVKHDDHDAQPEPIATSEET